MGVHGLQPAAVSSTILAHSVQPSRRTRLPQHEVKRHAAGHCLTSCIKEVGDVGELNPFPTTQTIIQKHRPGEQLLVFLPPNIEDTSLVAPKDQTNHHYRLLLTTVVLNDDAVSSNMHLWELEGDPNHHSPPSWVAGGGGARVRCTVERFTQHEHTFNSS